MTTKIIDYNISNQIRVDKGWKKFWNIVFFRTPDFIFEVDLLMGTSVGYTRNTLLLLDTYTQVVVLKSDGRNVQVRTVTPAKQFKETASVVTIITRKWGGII